MKTSKRILSFLLTVVMMLSIVPMAAVQSNAATLTQSQFDVKVSEAKAKYPDGAQKYEWSVNGTVVGWQCHGYARWLSWYVWGADFANGYGENWTLLKSTASSTPIYRLVPGDVVRYRSSTANAYNHTIFITNIVGDTIYFTDCNSDGRNTIRWNRSISKSSLDSYLKNTLYGSESSPYGYIAHYALNILSTTAPEPPAAPKNVRTATGRTAFSEKESITFLWDNSADATDYWVYMWKDGLQIYSTNVGNSNSHTTAPLGSGKYTLIVRAGNAYGYSNEKASVDFVVCNSAPTIATISSDKSLYKTGENIQLSMSSDCAELYWLGIDKLDEAANKYVRLSTQQVRNSSTFNYTVSEPGIYRIYATAYNEFGSTDSPYIYCQVYNTVCSDYKYEIISEAEKTCRITSYTGESPNVAIPAKISEYAVMEIGDEAFYGCKKLKSIVIPGTVESIGTIDDYYGLGAFQGCTSLENVTIETGVKFIQEQAFYECTSLKSIVIPNTVTEIGDNAFRNCSQLESAVIPGSVEAIPNDAFNGCVSLTNVTIGNGVKNICDEAFYGCKKLKSIVIPGTVESIGTLDDYYGLGAFQGCTSLENVTIEKGVKFIQEQAFYECTSLKSIVIPNTATEIGKNAFRNCSQLESAVIPGSVEAIPNDAFNGCVSLTNVTIGNGVKNICDEAFYGCKKLKSIVIPGTVESIGTLDDYYGLGAFQGCTSLENVTIEKGVKFIQEQAFCECTSLKSIVIPNTVTEIGDNAFYNCPTLTIYGYSGSYAESYAKVSHIPFVPLDAVSSISIQSKPTKTVYTVGEKFDASGLSIKVTMSDGTTKTVTSGFTVSNPDMTAAGTKTVTVTYSGKTTSFTITVKPAEQPVNTGALRLITPASARIGQTVQIPVQLDKASLGTLTFTVTYDRTKLKYVSCTESAFDMCDAYAGNTGVVKLACIDNTAVSAGKIAVLTFEVIAPAACLTDLTVAIEEAYDGSDKAVSLAGGTWNLSVVKTLLGDVNGDGKITAIDARWALQAASGARTLTEEQKAAADANGDGKITAIDARWILQAASGSRVL